MKAVIAEGRNEQVRIDEIEVGEPAEDEVRIKKAVSGVFHACARDQGGLASYDLAADPNEVTNLYHGPEYANLRESMMLSLLTYQIRTRSRTPKSRTRQTLCSTLKRESE